MTEEISTAAAVCPLKCCQDLRSNRSRQTTVSRASLHSQMDTRSTPSPKASDSVLREKNSSQTMSTAATWEQISLASSRCPKKARRFCLYHKKGPLQPSRKPTVIYMKYELATTVLPSMPAAAVSGTASRMIKAPIFFRQDGIFCLFILFAISMLCAPTASLKNNLSDHHVIHL